MVDDMAGKLPKTIENMARIEKMLKQGLTPNIICVRTGFKRGKVDKIVKLIKDGKNG